MHQTAALLAKIMDHPVFFPLHQMVRLFYLLVFPPTLSFFLRGSFHARHSVVRGGKFHCLLSDIDFSLCVPSSANPSRVQKMIKSYLSLKRIFLMLGELEVYYKDEWAEKEKLERTHGPFLQTLRDFRKTRWMDSEFEKYQDPYHKFKAERAKDKIKSHYGDFIEAFKNSLTLSHWLRFRTLPEFSSKHLSFYDREISEDQHGKDLAWLLLSIAPIRGGGEVPKLPELKYYRRLALTHELLCYRAYLRVNEASLNASDEWLASLQGELCRAPFDPDLNSTKRVLQWSEIHEIPENQLCHPFDLEADLTRRVECHLNGKYIDIDEFKNAVLEEKALYYADQIHVSDEFIGLWIRINYPHLESKINSPAGQRTYDWEMKEELIPNALAQLEGFSEYLQASGFSVQV